MTCDGVDVVDTGDNRGESPRREARRLRGDRGETIQAIVVLPVLLIMIMLIVQFGLALHARQVMAASAQDGAAAGAALDSSPGGGKAVTDGLVNSTIGGLVVDYTSAPSISGDQLTITTRATAKKVFPLFPTLTLTASGSATFEEFEAQGP